VQAAAIPALKTVERVKTGAVFYPLDRRFYEDPYPQYRQLREKDPFHKSMLTGGWVLSRHRDISAVLRDPRFLADNRKLPEWPRFREEMIRSGALTEKEADQRMMLTSDPPDHTRLRSLINRAFTPRAVEALRPRMEEIVEEQLSRAATDGRMDVIADLASPLPVIVISEMLGVPTADREQFTRWSHGVARSVGNVTTDEQRIATGAERELRAYLAAIVEQRRREPREDLLSALVAAEQDGDKLSMDEVYSMAVLLLVAGNETTTNLIGNGLIALLRHPEQAAALRENPSLAASAIEELLRFDSPVQMTTRFSLEDADICDGRVVKGGKPVFLLLGSGNRDSEAFERPDELDVTRTDNRHLSFSNGIHYCLGAPLARAEGQIALPALVSRFPDMHLARERFEWSDNIVLRGVRSLPVTLS
jgi:cytochrome P450